jgi:hypothetical protein
MTLNCGASSAYTGGASLLYTKPLMQGKESDFSAMDQGLGVPHATQAIGRLVFRTRSHTPLASDIPTPLKVCGVNYGIANLTGNLSDLADWTSLRSLRNSERLPPAN